MTAEEHEPPKTKEYEENPERLSLVFEPEAAAAWCASLTADKVKDISDFSEPLSTEDCFLTADVGGGTIDITGHQISADNKMLFFNLPHGNVYGGSVVNEAFVTFINEQISMGNIKYYFASHENHLRTAEFLSLKEEEFEKAKKQFADDTTRDYYSVRLPVSYVQVYEEHLERYSKTISEGATLQFCKRGHQLRISGRKMQELHSGCLYQLEECINNAISCIQSIGKVPKILYLVGGFGGCQYVAEHIRNVYGKTGMRVIIPQFHDLAVVRGACLYYKNKPIRTADATYGTVCKLPYDERNHVHQEAEKVEGKDGAQFCVSLFKPFVHMVEQLRPEYVYKTIYAPIKEDQQTMLLTLYSIKKQYMDFVKKDGETCPGMRELGHLLVDLTKLEDVPFEQRQVQLLVDFSSVEITINAHFTKANGEVVQLKTSTDFLSIVQQVENTCNSHIG